MLKRKGTYWVGTNAKTLATLHRMRHGLRDATFADGSRFGESIYVYCVERLQALLGNGPRSAGDGVSDSIGTAFSRFTLVPRSESHLICILF